MWISAEYEATALFSLKPATSTASGGKTLLVPTPYAVKMALLNAAILLEGQARAEAHWRWINTLTVAIRPSQRIIVNNTFIKVLKPRRNPAKEGSQDAGFFGRTITYREYAYFADPFAIALQTDDPAQQEQLARWLLQINYLGKRGSFLQILGLPETLEVLPETYIIVNGESDAFSLNAILTQLDDTGEKVTFDHVNIYSSKSIRLGKERILHHVALPYRVVSSSRSYTEYERVTE